MSGEVLLAILLAQTGEIPWLQLQDYPAACSLNTAITELADNPVCTATNILTLGSDFYFCDLDSSGLTGECVRLYVDDVLSTDQDIKFPDDTGTVCLDTGDGCGAENVVDHVWNSGQICDTNQLGASTCEYWSVTGLATDRVLAEFIFAGSDYYPSTQEDKFCIRGVTSTDPGGDVELYDMTNSNEVATITLPTVSNLLCTTDFSNIPADTAYFVLQADIPGSVSATVYSAMWVRVPAQEEQGGFRAPFPGPGVFIGG